MRLLGLCGSLREASANAAVLQALAALGAKGEIDFYRGVGQLPPFNPDLDDGVAALPHSAAALREAVRRCDGLVIAMPEYAHGVPGAFKNALDWLVGDEHFAGKPVMLINAAPRAFHAQAQLREILATMAARVVAEACVSLPVRPAATAQSILDDGEQRARLAGALDHFRAALIS